MHRKPEPIAKPSGKLWRARPILTIIPVFNKLFLFIVFFGKELNFFCTNISQKIIAIIPIIIPNNTFIIFEISIASGIKSKHIMASISPDAKDKIKLKNLLDVLFKVIPIIPPIVVPNVPKNNPINVVFNKYSNKKTP